MRPRTLISRALPLLLLLLCVSQEAKADPVVITSGFVSFGSQSTFSLQGQGVSVGGVTRNILAADLRAPGGTFLLSRTFTNDPLLVIGPFAVGGVTYNTWLGQSDGLVLRIEAPNAVLPTGADQQTFVFIAPFTMTGVIFVSAEHSGVPGGLRTEIVGSGTATYTARRANSPDPNAPWLSTSLTYTFGPAQPVPEPATMLLLGTGLAAFAARVRLRGRR
ncbi:MAG TPA: PEP-CTERM sorting domain-containing protein [Pyrinomonadaceae bacterium]|jgi:hypothetical protein|nr:PEP-CTERM sorting domain-containing protein [Pyrinomonadaceae bacterium]